MSVNIMSPNILSGNILVRNIDADRIKDAGQWVFIYGRRKTGKTFFVKNFLKWDEYFFIGKEAIFDKDLNRINYDTFLEIFKRSIGSKAIVIDEFHRLPESFFDLLHYIGKKGDLVVLSSTLWLSKKLLGQGSPMLGLFTPFQMNLTDERDVIAYLAGKGVEGAELVEAGIYLREVTLIPNYKPPARKFMVSHILNYKSFVKDMIREIFDEEGREISKVYEGIMEAVASGKSVSTEMSSHLYSVGAIPKDNPGFIQRYLDALVNIGILGRTKVFEGRKYRYFHTSPLLDLYFYLNQKYGFGECDVPLEFIEKVVDEKLPFHAEMFFTNLLSKICGLQKTIIDDPQIDIALMSFKKLALVGEVKWKKRIRADEIKSIEQKLSEFGNIRKILVVPEMKALEYVPEGIEVVDASGLKDLLKKEKGLAPEREQ